MSREIAQLTDIGRARRGEVLRFPRIRTEVVQLRHRQLDVLQIPANHSPERRPAPIEVWREGFEIGRRRRLGLALRRGREKAAAAEIGRRRDVERLEHRRQDVDMPRVRSDDPRFETSRGVDDQRHAQGRFVGEHAVRRFAVLAERFAVIGRQDDQRPAAGAAVQNRPQQRFQRGVSRGNLRRVRIVAEPRAERLGRPRTARAARRDGPSRSVRSPACASSQRRACATVSVPRRSCSSSGVRGVASRKRRRRHRSRARARTANRAETR